MIDNTSSRSGVNIARALDDQPPIHLLLPYIDERNSKSRVANDLGTLKKNLIPTSLTILRPSCS